MNTQPTTLKNDARRRDMNGTVNLALDIQQKTGRPVIDIALKNGRWRVNTLICGRYFWIDASEILKGG